MSAAFEAFEYDLDGLTIRGIRRRPHDSAEHAKLLCLHGWLDNAASFVPLMPHIPNADIVAVDLPGHGYSDHVASGPLASYALFDHVAVARRLIDALQWSQCHLIGHSLGGGVTAMLAAAAPAITQSLILIEAAGALSEEASALPQRLSRALDDRLTPGRYASRRFATKEDAVEARLAAARMERPSARLIIDRQLKAEGSEWRWRFDPALRHASPSYHTEAQVLAVMGAAACRSLSIIAADGFLANKPALKERFCALPDNTIVNLPGHHHVHMDTPEPVAAAINRFLGLTPALGG